MSVSADDKKRVKGLGFLNNRGTDNFSARIITENGVLTAAQIRNLSEVAEKFGNGNVSFTSRLTVEIPGIPYENIERVREYVKKEGMVTGGTGPKVRPVVACKGTVCVYGNIDTQGLATEIHKRFFEGFSDVVLPHKFKIAVGGCPNNCVKPDLNDIGIVGKKVPKYNKDLCKGCKVCKVNTVCPMKAQKFNDGIMEMDKDVCTNCGICVERCVFGAIPEGEVGYEFNIGGRWGKKIRIGSKLSRLLTKDEVLDTIERAILFYKDNGLKGERFSSTIDRIGMEEVEKQILK